ncbi:hypothetical protein ACFO4E_20950 [Nocardiopsis mangrovi]|uniref:Uncharacterized protein n=1 Tax=Nocardiopsis mangrovi TaxID=1179818 RepID=A0ABV9E165_9ACTN
MSDQQFFWEFTEVFVPMEDGEYAGATGLADTLDAEGSDGYDVVSVDWRARRGDEEGVRVLLKRATGHRDL